MRRRAPRLTFELHRRARAIASALAFTTATSLAPVARAEAPPRARLRFERDTSAESCPDEASFRRDVAARVGYEPFDEQADRTLHVRVVRSGDRFTARIALERGGADAMGERTLAAVDCDELIRSAASSAAMAIDPFALGAVVAPRGEADAPPVEAPRRAEARREPAKVAVAPAPPRSARSRWRGVGSLGGVGAFGVTPDATAGGLAAFELRHPHASIGVEGRAHLPASAPALRGSVEASTLVGSLVPCGWLERYFLCAVVSLGAMRGEGKGVSAPQRESGVYGALALRAGAALALADRLSLRPFGELATPLRRMTLTIDGAPAWTTPTVSASLGLAIAATFW